MLTLSNILMGVLLVSMWVVAAFVIRGCSKTLKTPQPAMPGAMMLVLLTAAASVAMQFILGMTMGFSMLGFQIDPAAATHLRIGLTAPIWMLVGASIYRSLLPTTYGKAMTIFVMQAAIVAAMAIGVTMLASVTEAPALMDMRQMFPW
jgi:hypothetical protein